MKKKKVFGRNQIRAIARRYGFNVEFNEDYSLYPTSYFNRINEEEDIAYFSGGPNIQDYYNGKLGELKEEYYKKYGLPSLEYDRFESPAHAEDYFKWLEGKFYNAYPHFRNK